MQNENQNPDSGFTQIPNNILEKILRFPFTSRELIIVLAVIRKTLGWQKSFDVLSHWKLSQMTGIDKSNISRAVRSLLNKDVLIHGDKTIVSHGQVIKSIGLNQNFEEWQTGVKKAPVSEQHRCQNEKPTGAKSTTQPVPNRQPQKKEKKKQKKRQDKSSQILISKFFEDCKAANEDPIPVNDPIFNYANDIGLPHEWLELCWLEFVERNQENQKRYIDWRQAFRNCVRANWYKLWWLDGDQYKLTTAGQQAKRKAAA